MEEDYREIRGTKSRETVVNAQKYNVLKIRTTINLKNSEYIRASRCKLSVSAFGKRFSPSLKISESNLLEGKPANKIVKVEFGKFKKEFVI